MSVTVKIAIEDPAEAMATYQSIKLYRDTDPGGAFSTLVDTEALVAGTYEYLIEDTGGGSASWYRFLLYHATGPVQSELSAPFQAGVTLAWLRIEAAIRAGAGFKGTATGGSTAGVLTDAALVDQGVDTNFLAGAWFYRPDAANATDKLRRAAETPFNTSTGAVTMRRTSYTASPSGEAYHVFNLMPPIDQPGVPFSWDRAVRAGLERVRYRDMLVLGEGDGETYRYPLDTHANQVSEQNIQRVIIRQTDSDGREWDADASKQGRYWELAENAPGSITLVLSHAPLEDEQVIVEALCKDAALYSDDDTTLVQPERAIRATVYEAYRMMNAAQPGRYAGEMAWAWENFRDYEAEHEPVPVLRLV